MAKVMSAREFNQDTAGAQRVASDGESVLMEDRGRPRMSCGPCPTTRGSPSGWDPPRRRRSTSTPPGYATTGCAPVHGDPVPAGHQRGLRAADSGNRADSPGRRGMGAAHGGPGLLSVGHLPAGGACRGFAGLAAGCRGVFRTHPAGRHAGRPGCAALHVPSRKSDRDALIAATALVHDSTVVTRNVADFQDTGAQVLHAWDAPG